MWPNYLRHMWSKTKRIHSYCSSWVNVSISRGRIAYLRLLLLFLAGVVIGYLFASLTNETPDLSWRREPYLAGNSDNIAPTSTEKEVLLELWEQPTLLNLSNFTWLLNNENICRLNRRISKNPPLMMPVLVHTSRSHFAERLAIRKTWGSVRLYRKWFIHLVFLMGKADLGSKQPELNQYMLEEEERRLDEEQAQYGDLVIGNFVDSYRNLSYKHLMGYKWVLNFCPNATFVLKTDDDIFINILKWSDWRTTELDELGKNSTTHIPDIHCHLFKRMRPIRDNTSKWYVSNDTWPEPVYPRYCSGSGYGVTVELLKQIYLVSNDPKMLWIDDVFVTGILMESAKRRFNFKPVYRDLSPVKEMANNFVTENCENDTLFRGRNIEAVGFLRREKSLEKTITCLWNRTLDYRQRVKRLGLVAHKI